MSSTRRKPWLFFTVVLFVIALVGLMITVMPKGFKMTHEDIGAGKPALVFIYDPNLAISISQPEQMNIARDSLNDSIHFLIAKVGTPEGDQLMAKYNAAIGELLLFDASGYLIKRQFALKSASELAQWLNH